MIASDWGRWLIDEIELADPAQLTLWYLGCNGLVLKAADGTTVYIDPYLGTGDPPRTVRMIPVPFDPDTPSVASAVVVTHEHTDHLHGPSQGPIIQETGASLVASSGCIDLAMDRGWGDTYSMEPDQFESIEPGDVTAFGDLEMFAYQGTDPDADYDLTYVFEYDGVTVVHPGDGRPSPVLEEIGATHDVDVAVVAVGSVGMIPDKETREPKRTAWYNDPDDCIHVASQLRTNVLIPTHWDMWRGLTTDPRNVDEHRRSFEHPQRVDVLTIGDRYDCSVQLP